MFTFFAVIGAYAKSWQAKHLLTANEFVVFIAKLNNFLWLSSEYFNELSKEDQTNLKRKITLTTNDVLTDPYSLNKDLWKPDLSKLLDLSWGDIYNYLVVGQFNK